MEHVDFKDTYSQGDTDIRNCHINIGTGKEISIATLADLIVRTTGYRGKVEFNPTKPDGTMRKLTDVTKLMIISSDKTNTSGYQDIIFKYDIRSDIAIFSKLDVMTNTYFHASGKSSVSHNSHETIVFHPWIFQMK